MLQEDSPNVVSTYTSFSFFSDGAKDKSSSRNVVLALPLWPFSGGSRMRNREQLEFLDVLELLDVLHL